MSCIPLTKKAQKHRMEAYRLQKRIDSIKEDAVKSIDITFYKKKCRQIKNDCLTEVNQLKRFYGMNWYQIPDCQIKIDNLRRIRKERLALMKLTINVRKAIKKRRSEMRELQLRRDHAKQEERRAMYRRDTMKRLLKDICEYFDTDLETLTKTRNMSKRVVIPRRVFYKYGMERLGICGAHLSYFLGMARNNGSESRMDFTRSFKTHPEAKKAWVDFLGYMATRRYPEVRKVA